MDKNEWKKRIIERNDMTTHLVHLTKPAEDGMKACDVLIEILKDKKLIGSGKYGFIVGDIKAVCFQDTPIYSLTQNIYYEQKLRKSNKNLKIRYLGWGLLFEKDFIFNNGGRPVIYDKTNDAKRYLPEDEWWRIVNLDLSDENKFIDWSHEREWRVPDELEFQLKDISVIVPNCKAYKLIIKKCSDEGIDLIKDTNGVINIGQIFC